MTRKRFKSTYRARSLKKAGYYQYTHRDGSKSYVSGKRISAKSPNIVSVKRIRKKEFVNALYKGTFG